MSLSGQDKGFPNDPPMVTNRAPNSGTLYLDSRQSLVSFQGGKTNKCILGLPRDPNNTGFQGDDIDSRNIKRLAVKEMNIFWTSFNVNEYNNTLTFYSDQSAMEHTVQIPIGFYLSRQDLMQAIVNALNTVAAQSLITFNFATVSASLGTYALNSVGGEYYLNTNSPAVRLGAPLWNPPKVADNIPANVNNQFLIGPVGLRYTRYVDVICPQLGAYTRNPNRSNNNTANNIVYRLYLREIVEADGSFLVEGSIAQSIDRINDKLTFYNFERSADIQYLQFELRDEFGNLLYVPDGAIGTDSGFYWILDLYTEV